jgi:hypothetical protein
MPRYKINIKRKSIDGRIQAELHNMSLPDDHRVCYTGQLEMVIGKFIELAGIYEVDEHLIALDPYESN